MNSGDLKMKIENVIGNTIIENSKIEDIFDGSFIRKIADTLIENGMTFREEEDNDEFASELAEISTGSLPRTSADGFKGLIFVNNGLGDK